MMNMFLDMDIYFDHPDRVYLPGDTVTCLITVKSLFQVKCKYVRARIRCPFNKSDVEIFRVYQIATKRIPRTDKDQWHYRVGEKGLWSFEFVTDFRCHHIHIKTTLWLEFFMNANVECRWSGIFRPHHSQVSQESVTRAKNSPPTCVYVIHGWLLRACHQIRCGGRTWNSVVLISMPYTPHTRLSDILRN